MMLMSVVYKILNRNAMYLRKNQGHSVTALGFFYLSMVGVKSYNEFFLAVVIQLSFFVLNFS